MARLVICFHLCVVLTMAQTGQSTRPVEQDDVIKVDIELVQTDVTVFDKQGRFVKGLKREDFELRVDGKLQPIGFFEQVQAGTLNEEAQLAAARGVSSTAGASVPQPPDRGRSVLFFIDDMHLSHTGVDQARKLLARFIDHDLGQNDEAEIVTASGRLGFLQQLTDNKSVLRMAAERLSLRTGTAKDGLRPPMSEYQALQIDRGDRDALGYFVDELLRDNRLMSLSSAQDEVRRRASAILEQASYFTTITLSSLDQLVRSCAKLPGRKVLFLISDGFFIDYRHSDSIERMRLLTGAAGRSGVVIYSIDARGLIASLTDASTERAFDLSGRLIRANQGEIDSSQDALNALASDTGGRALFNTNDLHSGIDDGLKETSLYYLLGWRPPREGNTAGRFRRLEVVIAGRPELTVRVRRGFFDLEPPPAAARRKEPSNRKAQEQTVAANLMTAIRAPYPERQLPVSLSLNYLDTPGRQFTLTVSVQIPGEFFLFNPENGNESAQIDLAGAVLDERGQSGDNFSEHLTLRASPDGVKSRGRDLTYAHRVSLGPGLYQVRVAARDARTGHLGSAKAWVEIPDLSNNKLSLSSLLAGEHSDQTGAIGNGDPLSDSVLLSIDRRFQRDSYLRYLVFVYNSARAPGESAPDVVVQAQVLRNGQPVATTTSKKISTDGTQDFQRLPYAAELPLNGFPAGKYILQFTAIDRVAKSTASQQMRFEIY